MRSRRNASNKGRKKINEAKTVISYSSLATGCDPCLQRLSYKSIENLFEKTKHKNPKLFSKVTTALGLQQKTMDKFSTTQEAD